MGNCWCCCRRARRLKKQLRQKQQIRYESALQGQSGTESEQIPRSRVPRGSALCATASSGGGGGTAPASVLMVAKQSASSFEPTQSGSRGQPPPPGSSGFRNVCRSRSVSSREDVAQRRPSQRRSGPRSHAQQAPVALAPAQHRPQSGGTLPQHRRNTTPIGRDLKSMPPTTDDIAMSSDIDTSAMAPVPLAAQGRSRTNAATRTPQVAGRSSSAERRRRVQPVRNAGGPVTPVAVPQQRARRGYRRSARLVRKFKEAPGIRNVVQMGNFNEEQSALDKDGTLRGVPKCIEQVDDGVAEPTGWQLYLDRVRAQHAAKSQRSAILTTDTTTKEETAAQHRHGQARRPAAK